MPQRKQYDIRLPQLGNGLRVRQIAKKFQLRSKPGLGDCLDNFRIHLTGKTDFQPLRKFGRLRTQTGQGVP